MAVLNLGNQAFAAANAEPGRYFNCLFIHEDSYDCGYYYYYYYYYYSMNVNKGL
jgi:hypothetical protein